MYTTRFQGLSVSPEVYVPGSDRYVYTETLIFVTTTDPLPYDTIQELMFDGGLFLVFDVTLPIPHLCRE